MGAGREKMVTTKSGWDRISGDLTIWAGKSMAPVVSHRGGAWNCSPPQLHCSARSGQSAVANASPGRHNGETQRETQQENDVKSENGEWIATTKIRWDRTCDLWGFWRFKDLGNLMAHGCGKGKIATTESRWDRTCGDLTIWLGKSNGTWEGKNSDH